MTNEELREWARRCADITAGRMMETDVWRVIARRGREFTHAYKANGKPDHGTGMMTPRQCFYNTARTVLGLTAMRPEGLRYAEGFALSAVTGMWSHHAWVVTGSGLAVDRTWATPAARYVGVIVYQLGAVAGRSPGYCQLSDDSCGFPWAPRMVENPEAYERLWATR